MSVHDYLIEHDGVDWPAVLADWSWLLPPKFTLWLVNRFADLFIVLPDNSVHMLDVGGGELKKVASSRDEFGEQLDDADVANNWFMIPLVDELISRGITIQPGQCYSYKIPPVLGGDYKVDNIFVLGIPEHCAAYASIHSQLRGVPDGPQVVIETKSLPT